MSIDISINSLNDDITKYMASDNDCNCIELNRLCSVNKIQKLKKNHYMELIIIHILQNNSKILIVHLQVFTE